MKRIVLLVFMIFMLSSCQPADDLQISINHDENNLDVRIYGLDQAKIEVQTIELKLDDEVVDLLDETFLQEVENLYYDREYSVVIHYNNGKEDKILTETIKTEAHSLPSISVSDILPKDTSFSFFLEYVDIHNQIEVVSYELFLDNELIQTKTAQYKTFDELESNTNYIVKVNYEVEMFDGRDPVEKKIIFEVPTYDDRIKQFLSVALDGELGPGPNMTYRYETDIKYFIHDTTNADYIAEVRRVAEELNALIGMDITISETDDRLESNMLIHFGDQYSYRQILPANYHLEGIHLADGYTLFLTDDNSQIFSSFIMIGTDYVSNQTMINHIIREEMTAALGLIMDIHDDSSSIFYQDESQVTEFSELDRWTIWLLYNEGMVKGKNEIEASILINNILKEVEDEDMFK